MPEDQDGMCHPELLAAKQPGEGLMVRLPSANSATEAGVVVAPPGADLMERSVECFAELTFNQNKLAQINPLRDLPERYGAWSTVYDRYRRWCKSGLFQKILNALEAQARRAERIDFESSNPRCGANFNSRLGADTSAFWRGACSTRDDVFRWDLRECLEQVRLQRVGAGLRQRRAAAFRAAWVNDDLDAASVVRIRRPSLNERTDLVQ